MRDSGPTLAALALYNHPLALYEHHTHDAEQVLTALVECQPSSYLVHAGHVLVSPQRVVPRFGELHPEEIGDLW